ncbi:MAG: tRNA lysidine(34) synthetase TilS [Magnetococcales bacterium]|nr:tRNA lysidine(34) synthetase TilS [Magnetococcales bacterium]
MGHHDSFLKRFRTHLGTLSPFPEHVVVAVSGGADSTALLRLIDGCGVWAKEKITVAHFDHGLRACSVDDARFTEQLAEQLGLEIVVGHWQNSDRHKGNTASRARQARYDFLMETADQVDAHWIMTGHHRDDQAETVMERLMRGSGLQGLSGIRSKRPLTDAATMGTGKRDYQLVRPLLIFFRYELEGWLAGLDAAWINDPSNRKTVGMRNRLRLHGLPALQKMCDPGLNDRLAHMAENMQRADSALEWSVAQIWNDLGIQFSHDSCSDAEEMCRLEIKKLDNLPDELILRLLQRIHNQLTKQDFSPGRRARNSFLAMLNSPKRQWQMRIRGLSISRHLDYLQFVCHGTGQACCHSNH